MKKKAGLVFSLSVSVYIYIVPFHRLFWRNPYIYTACFLSAGMWHYVRIVFIGGENFGFAFLNGKTNEVRQKMGMLMGASFPASVCGVVMTS